MTYRPIRVAARAIIVQHQRLLLVNAFPGGESNLWCAPGGGAEGGQSLPDNLAREVFEETGLRVAVGAPCLVNEFHHPADGFHQVEVFFRCTITEGLLTNDWQDPERIVERRQFFTAREIRTIQVKPDSLTQVAFETSQSVAYDPLELLVT